jgi:hypothetical protein
VTRLQFTPLGRPDINRLLPPHPDPFHIYSRAELGAYEAAARHIWAIHHLLCDVPICKDRRPLQLGRHAYPGQPSTRAEHVVKPCCCEYLRWCTTQEDQGGIGFVVVASGFQIHPACPHHGHLANTQLIERMWESPYEYGILRDPLRHGR